MIAKMSKESFKENINKKFKEEIEKEKALRRELEKDRRSKK